MEINLLPYEPPTKKFFWQFAVLLTILITSFVSLVIWQIYLKFQLLEEVEAKYQVVISQKSELTKQISEINREEKVLQDYKQQVEEINNKRINWVNLWDKLALGLPTNGEIVNISYNEDGVIILEGVSPDLLTLAQFNEWLKKQAWIIEVKFSSAVNIQGSTNSSSNSLRTDVQGYTYLMRIKVDLTQFSNSLSYLEPLKSADYFFRGWF